MEQVAFRFLGIDFYWYGVFLAAAFIAGLANATWVGKRTGRQFPLFSDLLFWVVIGGIAGARLAYVAANWEEFARDPLKMANLRSGGLVFYGGLAGAAAAFLLFVRRRREGFWSLGDVAVTSLPLGHALGRIGCFMQGCCHGTTTASSFGILYPPGSPVWHNQVRAGLIEASSESCLPVHPVQIYEAVANIAIWGALILFHRRPHRDGQVVGLYAMLYGVTRFSMEALRGDERLRCLGGLSLAQAASVAVFVAGMSAWILAGRRADRAPQPKGG
jgi:phosphatidylglycerol:prolipoprotein diacylglycerol transferase